MQQCGFLLHCKPLAHKRAYRFVPVNFLNKRCPDECCIPDRKVFSERTLHGVVSPGFWLFWAEAALARGHWNGKPHRPEMWIPAASNRQPVQGLIHFLLLRGAQIFRKAED